MAQEEKNTEDLVSEAVEAAKREAAEAAADSVTDEAAVEETAETAADTEDETAEDAEEEAMTETTADAGEATEGDGSEAKSEKKFFKKKEKKDKKDAKIEELNDQLLRQRAEFINFRNRSEREKAQMFEVGAKSMAEKILPVIDNFERGLATLSEEEKQQPFAQGMEKTYKQMMSALKEEGVEPIEALGQPFDPNYHNAVMHIEDENFGENVVAEEFQKGYVYRDSVLRHSMVKVAN